MNIQPPLQRSPTKRWGYSTERHRYLRSPGTLKRPDVLKTDRFLEAAKEIEDIRAVSSPATLIREAHGKLTGKVSIPDDPNAIAQLLLIENHSEIENMLSLDYTRGRAS